MDADKRATYDKYGKEGLENGGGDGGGDAGDIFAQMFGGRGGGQRSRGPQKGEDIKHPMKVSLEDLYNGKTFKLAISRNKPCNECNGLGGKAGAEKTCDMCSGRGVRVQLRQIGPGMVQQMQSTCGNCKGAGKSIDERDKCKGCKGQKVMKDRKVLEVHVEKGMKNGHKIRFAGDADEIPGTIPGDVIITVQEKEHEVFKRKGADLVRTVELTLTEALCGFCKTFEHLDGRTIRIDSPAGQVIEPEKVKMIEHEGMPHHGNPFVKGRMFLLFKVQFPKTLPREVVSQLSVALPKPPAAKLSEDDEVCRMQDVDLSQFGQGEGHGNQRGATDEDDEEEGGGRPQQMQCAQG